MSQIETNANALAQSIVDAPVKRWLESTPTHLDQVSRDGNIPALHGKEYQGTRLELLSTDIEGIQRVLARNPADRITIGFAERGQCRGSAAKREIRLLPNRLAFILMPGEVLKLDITSDKLAGILLQVDEVELLNECKYHGTEDPDILSLQDSIPGHESLIMACAKQLLQLAEQPDGQGRSRLMQPLEDSVISLVASLVSNTQLITLGRTADQAQSHHVQSAIAYMEEHLTESITLSDLCRSCSVSARTLQSAFQVVMNESPLHVLQNLRLTRLRELLLQGMDVRSACRRTGLQPTGRMAGQYKRRFGELPRQTKFQD